MSIFNRVFTVSKALISKEQKRLADGDENSACGELGGEIG